MCIGLEYWRSVWLSLLYLRCPGLASSVPMVLCRFQVSYSFEKLRNDTFPRKYEQRCTRVFAAVTMSRHRKSCLCSFGRNRYAVNQLICLWVRMCFCNHVSIFCNSVLWHHFGLSLLWLSLVWTCSLHRSTPLSTFRDIKVSQSGHAAFSDYTETSILCRDRLLI